MRANGAESVIPIDGYYPQACDRICPIVTCCNALCMCQIEDLPSASTPDSHRQGTPISTGPSLCVLLAPFLQDIARLLHLLNFAKTSQVSHNRFILVL